MKWKNRLLKFIPIAIFVLGISIAIIYCFQQNIKANESKEELEKYKEEQMELGSIPEIKNDAILHWNIKGMKELQRWINLRNEIVNHYDLEEQYYKDDEYVDLFIHDNYLILSDKKYQKKMNNSDDYDMYAIDMNSWKEHRFIKFVDERTKQSYEKLL